MESIIVSIFRLQKEHIIINNKRTLLIYLINPRYIPYSFPMINTIIIPIILTLFIKTLFYLNIQVCPLMKYLLCFHPGLNQEVVINFSYQVTQYIYFITPKFELFYCINLILNRLSNKKVIFYRKIQFQHPYGV